MQGIEVELAGKRKDREEQERVCWGEGYATERGEYGGEYVVTSVKVFLCFDGQAAAFLAGKGVDGMWI